MRSFKSTITVAALAAGLALGTAGGSIAQQGIVLAHSEVPETGAAQGVNPPGSLPGGNTAFGASPSNGAAPAIPSPASGAAQGVTNPAPGTMQTGTIGETSTVR